MRLWEAGKPGLGSVPFRQILRPEPCSEGHVTISLPFQRTKYSKATVRVCRGFGGSRSHGSFARAVPGGSVPVCGSVRGFPASTT